MDTTHFAKAPPQSYPLLRKILPASWQPVIRGIRKRWQLRSLKLEEPFHTVFSYTQVSPPRQENLARICKVLEAENIPGAIVECGVLDGGTAGLMAYCTAKSGRPVELFDAWQGLPKTTAEDGPEGKKWESQAIGSPRRVARLMKLLKIDPARVHYHTGWFHDTFPKTEIPQIALLHVDCDFYEPVKLTLNKWYPSVVPGGFIQFDDYMSFQGCKTAADEFIVEHPELVLESYGFGGVAYFVRKP